MECLLGAKHWANTASGNKDTGSNENVPHPHATCSISTTLKSNGLYNSELLNSYGMIPSKEKLDT